MTKNMFMRFLPAALMSMLAFAVASFGQAGTGAISGIVSDTNGAVVKGATVTLTSKGTNETKSATTNDDGIYSFVLLKPGKYSVKTSAASFGEVTLDVEVQVGRTTDANVTLGVGSVSAVVEVNAGGIQTTSNNFDAVQNETAIQNLPINGRRFQDFVTLTPTAQVDPQRGQISLSGQRGINSNVSVDGVDYNQPFFGGIRGGERSNSAFTLPQEAIREFQVVAAGYSAEFGRSSGGIVNAVTKSGTNDFRGSLFYLLRPKQLARGHDFSQALLEQKLKPLGLDATLAPTLHQFGGSVGGPIAKDRLFFFASYEQQRFRAPRQIVFPNLPTTGITARQADAFAFYNPLQVPFTQTNDAKAVLGKIDWNVTDSNRFNIRYNFSTNKALNAVSTGETALDPTTSNSLSTNGTEENRNHIVVAQLVSTISSNFINEFRGQYAKETRPRTPNQIVSNINTAVGVYGTRNFLPTTQYDRRYQAGDNVTFLSGAHTLKFGFEYSDIFADQTFGFNQTGVYSFAATLTGAQVLDNISPLVSGTYYGRFDTTTARYAKQVGNLAAAYGVKELSFFGQDSWRVNRKLTLNFGLRYERQYNPDAQANNTAVVNAIKAATFPIFGKTVDPTRIPDSQHEWGPRVGFAYDPKGDGKTVIRAYAGEYYARTPLLILAGPFNNFRDPAGDLSVTLGSVAYGGTTPNATTASNFNFPAFFAANPSYAAITGLSAATCATAGNASPSTTLYNSCAPNTVFRQFAIIGINLNAASLSSLPALTSAQLAAISSAMNNAISPTPSNFGIYQNAAFTGITPNFKNPQSFQFGAGVEHEMWKGVVLGLDYSQVNTSYLQRNRDINLPAPTGVDAVTGRVLVNRASRPLTSFGQIQLRDSSGRSRYRALTFRMNLTKSWVRLNAFYTLSRSQSDDDNERDAGGVLYDNPYDLSTEYYNSRLDRRHQFVANPLFYLPLGIELSSGIRIRSGTPINSQVGSDLNGDGNSNERPIIVPGVELPRNYYTNRPLYDVDLRVQRALKFSESRKLVLSAEFFNVLNLANIQLGTGVGGSAITNFCRNSIEQPGQPAAPALARCGLDGITNSTFLQVRDQRQIVNGVANPAFGKISLLNGPGSQVFQMQLGARFYF